MGLLLVVVEEMKENEEDNMHGAIRSTGRPRPSRLQLLLFSKRARKKHKIRRFLIYLFYSLYITYLGE
jgi:hypothetical protein